ncbi:MAG TPA: hypothetical protein VL337_04185 [Acidimicrobiales bacterium]|jgi:transposase|nr:hypothetical protein [Acidimicrobiales bacterium]
MDGTAVTRLTPDLLEELYLRRGMTCREIAEQCGYRSMSVVQRAMAQAGIPARTSGARPCPHVPAHPREVLERLYVREGMSARAIAVELGYRSHSQVMVDLRTYGIPTRPSGRSDIARPGIPPRRATPPRPEMALNRKQLEDLHYRQGLTLAEIATRLGTYPRRISRRAEELGVPIRKLHSTPGARLPAGAEARLAALYGRRDVSRALRRHGVPRRDAAGAAVNALAMHHDLLDDLYGGCRLSATEIGLLLARSNATVMRQLRADSIPIRPPPPRRPPREKRPPLPPGQPLTREILLDLYMTQNLTLQEVAEHTGWRSGGPVRTALRREGIPIRRMTVPPRKVELTRDLLEDLYVNQALSMPTIVRVLGDFSVTTIREALLREGIPIRGPRYTSTTPMPELTEALLRAMYLDQRLRVHEIAERLGYARAAVSRALREQGLVVEPRRGRPRAQRRECNREILEDLYISRDLSAEAVGEELGVSAGFVLKRLHDFGIPVRRNRWQRPDENRIRLDCLRKDRRVRAALIKAGVPRWREEGTAVPEDPLPSPLLETLYADLGLAMFDIELLTGRSESTIRAGLVAAGIPVKPRPGYRATRVSKSGL